MFTIFMMVLSVLVTLYFTKPGFKKAVKYFFDMSDKKTQSPSSDSDESVPVLTEEPVQRKRDLGWKRWTKADAREHYDDNYEED